ncbi:hypothetical protein [Campylobacter concisus]|uniref:hypothetical protein n=1 Tax=Campylobacter concisus TaxID=199 RepID=UPI001CA553A8|nr:hypothetical protein [Campylobacter concisus]
MWVLIIPSVLQIYYFYKKDGEVYSIIAFDKFRPRDINIETTILEDILERNLQKPGYRFFIGRC